MARRRGLGRGKDGRNKALFHDFTVVEDRNVIADLLHHAHLVCDDDDGDAKLFVDVADQLEDLARRLGVERARGLVAEQNFGVRGEGAGDGHALLLSAGELRGIGLGLILEPHDLEEFQSSLFAPLLLSPQSGKLHREADVSEAVSLHQQVEALEDHRDLAPRRAELRGGHRVQTLSVHDDLALRRALEHIDTAHERGFAGTAHADDAVDVAVRNGQGDVLERVYPSAGCFKGFA